jgi:5-methylcytosine-specific restriction protein A
MAKWPYSTARWQKVRACFLAENPLCIACLERGVTKPATEVDHRQAILQGGDPWSWENLAAYCKRCHSAKTMAVDRQGKDRVPIKGCDVHGYPLDPEHPWNKDRGGTRS